ncbi:MAG: nickel pincer cofactor biosynthesis protein LarC [Elusimicrobiota bacterium]
MKKVLYFNCASGIAGDMIIASLIDAGVPAAALEQRLKRALRVKDWKLKCAAASHYHCPAKTVQVTGLRHFNSPYEMLRILRRSSLPAETKAKSIAIIETLIRAESRVHGVPKDKVHFHELNSIDTLIDTAGSCLAAELLGITEIRASQLNIGRPAPATLEIIKENKIPVYSDNSSCELTTPTGAAIISNIASGFGAMPPMIIEKSGFGGGTKFITKAPNMLQAVIGRIPGGSAPGDEVILLETNIDDLDPRVYPYVMELLLKAGAKDTWLTHIIMKKGRPGTMLSTLCAPRDEGEMVLIIFRETTTLGIRRIPVLRHILARKSGKTRKIAYLHDGNTKSSVEFEQARKMALKTGQPLKDIL